MIERQLDIPTPHGATTTFIVHPERDGAHPVVFFFMDAPAIREELRDMARRLATGGYYVILPNLYYRAGVMEIGPLADPDVRTRMMELMNGLTIDMVISDTEALLAFVDQDSAASDGPLAADKINAEVELYPAVEHGFAFPQRAAYDKDAAERHWERLNALYRRRLG